MPRPPNINTARLSAAADGGDVRMIFSALVLNRNGDSGMSGSFMWRPEMGSERNMCLFSLLNVATHPWEDPTNVTRPSTVGIGGGGGCMLKVNTLFEARLYIL